MPTRSDKLKGKWVVCLARRRRRDAIAWPRSATPPPWRSRWRLLLRMAPPVIRLMPIRPSLLTRKLPLPANPKFSVCISAFIWLPCTYIHSFFALRIELYSCFLETKVATRRWKVNLWTGYGFSGWDINGNELVLKGGITPSGCSQPSPYHQGCWGCDPAKVILILKFDHNQVHNRIFLTQTQLLGIINQICFDYRCLEYLDNLDYVQVWENNDVLCLKHCSPLGGNRLSSDKLLCHKVFSSYGMCIDVLMRSHYDFYHCKFICLLSFSFFYTHWNYII